MDCSGLPIEELYCVESPCGVRLFHDWTAMVQLKRVLVVCLAFAGALVLAELFVRYLVHYPLYGVSERVYGMRAPGISSNVFSPYSENWSVEGGNRVYRRNNLGLTGVD